MMRLFFAAQRPSVSRCGFVVRNDKFFYKDDNAKVK